MPQTIPLVMVLSRLVVLGWFFVKVPLGSPGITGECSFRLQVRCHFLSLLMTKSFCNGAMDSVPSFVYLTDLTPAITRREFTQLPITRSSD